MAEKIKPCWHCGEPEKLAVDMTVGRKYVVCGSCLVEGECGDTVKQAINNWNHRPIEQQLIEALEAAKKTMRNCQGAIESNQVIDKDVRGNLERGQDRIAAALKSAKGEA